MKEMIRKVFHGESCLCLWEAKRSLDAISFDACIITDSPQPHEYTQRFTVHTHDAQTSTYKFAHANTKSPLTERMQQVIYIPHS